MTNFESVRKFMETFGQEIKEKASFPNEKITSLRYDLIREELGELKEAIKLNPTNNSTHLYLGIALLHIGYHEKAIQEFEKSIDTYVEKIKMLMEQALDDANCKHQYGLSAFHDHSES